MSTSRYKAHIHGFTLLEIVIVVALLIIIVAISMQSIQKYAQRQSYQSAVEHVRSELYGVREKTLASYDDTVYGVYVGTTSIQFFSGATPVINAVSNTILKYADYNMTAVPSFSDGRRYITFARITGAASATGTIKVYDTHRTATTTFTISRSGLIE
jgi:Tfp pilus assembly protein FimT